MTSRHRAWRSPASLAFAASPWIVILGCVLALAALLAVTLWNRFAPGSTTGGGVPAIPQLTYDVPGAASGSAPTPVAFPASGDPSAVVSGGAAGAQVPASASAQALTPARDAGPAIAVTSTTTTATATPTAARTTTSAATSTRDAFATIQAESYDARSGITVETCDEGGKDITSIASGDWARFDDVAFGATSPTDFVARVSSGVTGGASGLVQVRLDSPTATPIGDFAIDNTGGWQSWRSVPGNVGTITGTHTVYLTFSTTATTDFVSVNWFSFRH